MDKPIRLAEGKTKIIWLGGDGEVFVESKDDITAGDGAKHDLLSGKAAYSTQTTCNCFGLLNARGVPTHYLGRLDERTFRAIKVDMVPLELVARRVATGSYLKRRPDVAEGTVFGELVVEFFEKDDANHDPLVVIDLASSRLLRFAAGKPLADGFLGEQSLADSRFRRLTGQNLLTLINLTRWTFEVLEQAWARQGVTLVDLKIECGLNPKGGLIVADVIDNDSWRIWPGGDKSRMRDKQVYRNLGVLDAAAKAVALASIKDNYAWVAEATDAFAVRA